jgi:hypothetical protein
VDIDTPARLDVTLTPVTYELEELVVSGEDPAVSIMRKVIERKQAWRRTLTTYQAEAYTRFMLYRASELVQMKEEIKQSYWRPGAGVREVIRAQRTSPRGTGVFRFAAPVPVVNFYDDNVQVQGFNLIGPTHPEALEVYTFTLGGHRRQDDQVVYDIYFSPRRAINTTFIGHLSVLDSVYAVIEAGMRPHPDNVLPPPIIASRVYYEQHFAPVEGGYWLPLDLHVTGSVEFGRTGARHPPARYEQVSRLTHHVVNVPAPDSLYRGGGLRFEHPLIAAQEYLFRWNPGLVPLTPREIEAVVALDPGMSLQRAFRPVGMLAGYVAVDVMQRPPPDPEEEARKRLSDLPSGFWPWFNRVDGWHIGLKHGMNVTRQLALEGGLAYNWERKRPSFEAGLTYTTGRAGDAVRGFFRVGGSAGTHPRYASAVYTRFLAGAATYLGYDDYCDYYRRSALHFASGIRWARVRGTFEAGLHAEDHASIEQVSDHDGWLLDNTQRGNPAIEAGAMRSVSALLALGDELRVTPRAGARGVELRLEHSAPGFLGSAFGFTTYRGTLAWTLPTLVGRRAWENTLSVRLTAGSGRGRVPPQRYAALDAAIGPFAPFGGFKALRGLPYEGDAFAAVFWEHDFATLPFELLGLWRLSQTGIGLVVHGAHGRTRVRTAHALGFEPHTSPGVHHEAGLSLTNFFNLPVRIDVTHRLDEPGWFFGLGVFKRF